MTYSRRDKAEVMVPKRTIRYCIRCGRNISDALFCDTPDCGGIPNFYRDVPAPERRRKQPERRERGPSPLVRASVYPAGARRTVPVLPGTRVETVAVLLGVDSPHRILIAPGQTEVGATQPAQAIIDVPEVSSRHAIIECSRGPRGWEVTITDCRSTNGTYVNGKRIETARLTGGDLVRFAVVEFEFRLIPGDDARTTLAV
jgi:hypothetical protein